MFNTHTHIFTFSHVPDKFLPLKLVRYLLKKNRMVKLAKLLNWLNPFSDNDTFQRYGNFLRYGLNESQYIIYTKLKYQYPDETRFVILPMDFEFMKAGKTVLSYFDQLNKLVVIKKRHDEPETFLPFVMVDPRRKNIVEMAKMYIKEDHFSGIKLYPSLGYYPFDERLYPLYEFAQENQIPIITHCSPGGIYYKGKITKDMLIHPRSGKKLEKKRNKLFCNNFSHPDNYNYVLEDFPALKICFAHYGGHTEWDKYIFGGRHDLLINSWLYKINELLEIHPNTYTDISYTFSFRGYLQKLSQFLEKPFLKNKILFGSDYYMSQIEDSESEMVYTDRLKEHIGEEKFRQISLINPQIFLKSKLS